MDIKLKQFKKMKTKKKENIKFIIFVNILCRIK